MRARRFAAVAAALLLGGALGVGAPHARAELPQLGVGVVVTDLGSLDGNLSAAFDINDVGQAVGVSWVHDAGGVVRYHAVLFARGQVVDLGVPAGATDSMALDINNQGVVVGFGQHADGHHPAAFTPAGGSLPFVPGDLGEANAISDSGGTVVGELFRPARHAFAAQAGSVSDLGGLGGPRSDAVAVDASGVVAGNAVDAAGQTWAVTYSGGAVTNLGTLPGGTSSTAADSNALGTVVGSATLATGQVHAASFAGGMVTDLGVVPGDIWSGAAAVNLLGIAVGQSCSAASCRAALFVPGAAPVDLNSLLPAGSGWVLERATGVNVLGQVVGIGTLGGHQRAFMLGPVLPR